MGWEATGDSWAGRQPGQDPGLPGSPGLPAAGFEHGGPWAEAAPSAALAVALERAAGPEDRYDGAETDALVGIARQWAAVESWAAAGKLAALRAMTREDGQGLPLLRRRQDLPDGWDDSLTYEISGALAMGPVSAGNLASLAWALGTRLAGIGRLLAGKTYFQVERLAWRAALAVAPDIAERRRTAAERQARVTVFREESGAVGLSGRDLPAAEALAGHANVTARARQYQASGLFPGESAGRLEALAYTDLLNQVGAGERLAFASSDDGDGTGGHDGTGPQHGEDDPGPSGDPGSDGEGPRPGEPGPDGCDQGDEPNGPDDPQALASPLAEVTVPLATLQRRAERAGDNRLLGPIDPALARDLAAAAARSPASHWEITVVDEHGYATGHAIVRTARGAGPQPPSGPASCALPARVNITITQALLEQLETQAAQPRSGAPPGDWNLTPGKPGTWMLTLPGGRRLAARFSVVPTRDCDHRYAVSSYLPGDRLRRLVQVRDHECTWPPCSRPARDSDFEHAVPYDKGGVTDACNAGARSRRCHRVKQLPGWTVTQPRPGWHAWVTPTGRTYVQEPWQYTA